MSFPTKKAVAASMLLYCANGEKAFAPAGPAATMPRVHVPAASPAAVPFMQPQETMTWTQPAVEARSSTVEMVSNALLYTGLATLAAGAGMAPRTVAPVMLANVSAKDNVWGLPVQRSAAFQLSTAGFKPRPRAAQPRMEAKQTPHGGKLIDLMVPAAEKDAVKATATKTIDITERQSCDIELLCNGGLSPLTGFLNEDAYTKVVEEMRLPSGEILGLPIVMDTDDEAVAVGDKLLLQFEGTPMAVMTVESKWQPDKALECVKCYGVGTLEHPGVRMVAMERGKYYIGGPIQGLGVPTREFPCATPKEVREMLPG